MKKSFLLLLLVGFTSVLAGCLKTVELISDNLNPYTFEPGVAIVIVGGYGDARLGSVYAITNDGRYHFAMPSALSRNTDAFAWKIKVGDSFTVVRVGVSGGSAGRYAEFTKTHTLQISEQGIYYYGTIVTKENNIWVIPKVVPEAVAVAHAKYPSVFQTLKPINF
jgi:hypothetical protein